jgi:uncharacterized protein
MKFEMKGITRFMTIQKKYEQLHAFKQLGFTYVSLDLLGYRTGSMNENLF